MVEQLKDKERVFCQKHQCVHKHFPKYASCIEDKTMVKEVSAMWKSNHSLGCDLETFAMVLRFRGCDEEADILDKVASRIK